MRKIVAIILGVLIFIGILLIVTALQSLKKTSNNEQQMLPSPTATVPTQAPNKPNISYNKNGTDKLLLLITTRPTPQLSSDTAARQQIINTLGDKSGIISETKDYKLEYVKAPNDFETEIKTNNINSAKQQVINLLRAKGLTNDGICKLPLSFYLSFEVSNSLKGSNQSFSPIPDFCQ